MTDERIVYVVQKTERKRNPLGVVLCAAFLILAVIYLVRYHQWIEPLIFTLIGLPFLLVKENR